MLKYLIEKTKTPAESAPVEDVVVNVADEEVEDDN